ncbi:DUF5133 domain-containing protein [Streptomyces sp. NPDC054855]
MVLLPTPADLRRALARYADAVINDERHPTPDTARERENHAYTLCVMTGTTDIRSAMRTADALLDSDAAVQTPPPGRPKAAHTTAAAATAVHTATASVASTHASTAPKQTDVTEAA